MRWVVSQSRRAITALVVLTVVLPEQPSLSDTAHPVGAGVIGPVAIDPHNPDTVYAGTYCSGILKSLDGGDNWFAINDGLSDLRSGVGALVVDPTAPQTLYATTSFDGVFKTTDGGNRWSITALTVDAVAAVAVDPTASAVVYAGSASGTVGESGVFKSTDGGATWRTLFSSGTNLYVHALAIDPTESSRVYAGGYGDGSVFRSTDGGETWEAVLFGTDVRALVLDPASPATLYAGASEGVFKSTDAGRNWNTANSTLVANIGALAIDSTNPTTVYAGTPLGVYRSTDGGGMWRAANAGLTPTDVFALAIAPTVPTTLYVSSQGIGVNKSTNGAATWRATGLAVVVLCGDRIVTLCSETCDDGNVVNGDGCDSNCTTTGCGNHIVTAGEECDDGNLVSGDGCDVNCTLTACGNGIRRPGEGCDDSNLINGDGCDSNCTPTRCGNGIVTAGEQCDDGNYIPFDGCTAACTLCGDGVVTLPEECDDRNVNSSDGCTNGCTICGDAVVTAPETCDDGNLVDGDGCDADCVRPGCGNAVSEGNEECDDGGVCIGSPNAGTFCTDAAQCSGGTCQTFGGDGCAANCTRESDVTVDLVSGQLFGSDIVSGTSGVLLHGDILTVPLPLSGDVTLTIGKERNGQIPVTVKAPSVRLPSTPVSTLRCDCIRAVALKTCGGKAFEPDGVTPAIDCTPAYTAGDSRCVGRQPCTFVAGAGNSGAGVIGCNGLDGVNSTITQDAGGSSEVSHAPILTFRGHGGPGSAVLLHTSASGVTVGLCQGSSEEYGADGEFCTDDDPQNVRGLPVTSWFVTETASAAVAGANDIDGNNIGPFSVTGAPFDCGALSASPGTAAGAALVSGFTLIDQPSLGDVVVLNQFVANQVAPAPCLGDCNNSGEVTIEEIIAMVNVALGSSVVDVCRRGDGSGDGQITIDGDRHGGEQCAERVCLSAEIARLMGPSRYARPRVVEGGNW